MKMGYHGREIGEIFNNLLKAVHKQEVKNSYNDLLAYV
jgi:hypothetical protein